MTEADFIDGVNRLSIFNVSQKKESELRALPHYLDPDVYRLSIGRYKGEEGLRLEISLIEGIMQPVQGIVDSTDKTMLL